MTITRAFIEGARAFRAWVPRCKCPYLEGTPEHDRWLEGYEGEGKFLDEYLRNREVRYVDDTE